MAKGSQKVLDAIYALLPLEATAQAQYRAHAQMYRNWGYYNLKHHLHAFFYEEADHVKVLINRYLFLGGELDPACFTTTANIGADLVSMMNNDLDGENTAISSYNDAVEIAEDAKDNTTAKLFRHILKDQEQHAQWLAVQLHQISELGKAGYLTEQMDE